MSRMSASWPVASDDLRRGSGESAPCPTGVQEVLARLVWIERDRCYQLFDLFRPERRRRHPLWTETVAADTERKQEVCDERLLVTVIAHKVWKDRSQHRD